MVQLRDVDRPANPLSRFRSLVGDERQARLEAAAASTRALLGDSVVWNVNSTASGGGVAEMLEVLVSYSRGAGIDARWVVMDGDPQFFSITKRIHHRLHAMPGDGAVFSERDLAHYRDVTAANAAALRERIRPGDIVLCHDPQTAGMGPGLATCGASLVWRSHIGADTANEWSASGWELLRPYLSAFDAFVFSRASYVPAWLRDARVAIIPPSIDPFSLKNRELSNDDIQGLVACVGLRKEVPGRVVRFVRADGTIAEVAHRGLVVSESAPLDLSDPVAIQVSRWDPLKDMAGVMAGFASRVIGRLSADLVLAGPSVEGVVDDPEAAAVFARCVQAWKLLDPAARRRIHLLQLPMEDPEENAVTVNALQRVSTVVVQKSLAEGFGLTVAEAMWKSKPVVASAVGGIVDQVVPGTGVLLTDPSDLGAYGDSLTSLLQDRKRIDDLGRGAKRHVLEGFVGDRHLLQYAKLIRDLRYSARGC